LSELFGTDGIRGVALEPPLDHDIVTRLGCALADHFRECGRPLRVLMAGDTRQSTPVLAGWLAAAFSARGGEVVWAGVLPTPAVSHLLRATGGFGGGIVVSASHNPAGDNGIKLVSAFGSKLAAVEERRLEARLAALTDTGIAASLPPVATELEHAYVALLAATLPPQPLEGLKLVVDAANGAATAVADELFTRLGAGVTLINAAPDGRNINHDCGALHPAGLARAVVAEGADAGVAFDGDADRAILVTGNGRVLDGDDVLYVWGRALDAEDRLPGRSLVATVMSNLGLDVSLARLGMRLVRCPVGDREVWDAMEREGLALGGEQSGHVICAHHAVTGDGLLTAAHVLAIAARRGVPLEALADMPHFPQLLKNVRVAVKRPFAEMPLFAAAIRDAERRLDGHGRVFVRYSGTEPLLRIMVEAPTEEAALSAVDQLAALAQQQLG
jgi:phosphoglucosamine mutase